MDDLFGFADDVFLLMMWTMESLWPTNDLVNTAVEEMPKLLPPEADLSQSSKEMDINNNDCVIVDPESQVERIPQNENDTENYNPETDRGLEPVVEDNGEYGSEGVLISTDQISEEAEALRGSNQTDADWKHVEPLSFQQNANEEVDENNNKPVLKKNNEKRLKNPHADNRVKKQRVPVDDLIDKVVIDYWVYRQTKCDYLENILKPDSYNIHKSGDHYNTRFKGEFHKDRGLIHAIVKHGDSLLFLTFPNDKKWLEKLNKTCESVKNEKKHEEIEKLNEKIKTIIEDNFEDIIKLSKQLGSFLYESSATASFPMFQTLNKDAFLLFCKFNEDDSGNFRYYLIVLADGKRERGLDQTTVVTSYRLTEKKFMKRIKRNGKIPDCWVNYNSGKIEKCTPDKITHPGLYICLDLETIEEPFFLNLFHSALQWIENIHDERQVAEFKEKLKRVIGVAAVLEVQGETDD